MTTVHISIKKIVGIMVCILFAGLVAMTPVFAAEYEDIDLDDGEYSVSLEISGGSGKASVDSPTVMTVKDGKAAASITWSSSNYDYMIVGGEKYDDLSGPDEDSRFEIPILQWDSAMEVIADTTAMGDPVEVHYSFYFDSGSIGDKGQLPQTAAQRVLLVVLAIIVIGGILNYILKRRSRF